MSIPTYVKECSKDDFEFFETGGLKYPIPKDKNVTMGVNVSGGADSALGTYLLCKEIENNNWPTKVKVISYIRGPMSKPWQREVCSRVFNTLRDMFPNIISPEHVTTFIPETLEHGTSGEIEQFGNASGDQIIVREFNYYLAHIKKEVFHIYNFTTQAPLYLDGGMENRYHDGDKPWFLTTAIQPFANRMKDWVLQQYYDNDIMDLFNTTRSCEATIHNKLYKEWEQGIRNPLTDIDPDILPECGTCWWCRERDWAKNEIRK